MSDLISRQDAIELLSRMPIAPYAPEDDTLISQWEAIDKISDMPSAEPNTGKWVEAVKDGVLSYTDAFAKCDQCHEVKFNGWRMNYCPNCGAKMGGEDE